jgi:dTDP-4-amino-4,6-dideoxygalactose transaminase
MGLGDWKARLTSEPSRVGEDYASGDLEWVNEKIQISNDHRNHLNSIRIRPWNRVRQQSAVSILSNRQKLIRQRQEKMARYCEKLQNLPLELLPTAMPVRLPLFLSVPLNDQDLLEKLADRGIKKQYPATWPMYSLPLPYSQKFYQQAFSLPLHESVGTEDIEKNIHLIRNYLTQ